jgi:hypothetical protein
MLLRLVSGSMALKEKMHGLEQRIVYTLNRVVYLKDGYMSCHVLF